MSYHYHSTLKSNLNKYQDYTVTIETRNDWAYRFHIKETGKSYPIKSYRVPEYLKYLAGKIPLENPKTFEE
jgi:hypothetical protein